MKKRRYLISVIIPAKNATDVNPCLNSLRKIKYPLDLVEVLLVFGTTPSLQRNMAAKKAKGDFLYFLDNDSEISPQAFSRCMAAFSRRKLGVSAPMRVYSLLPPIACRYIDRKFFAGHLSRGEVAVVGGPSLWNRRESFWSSVSGIIFESFFAYFVMTSRFRPTGKFRYTDERELVLCNLAVKRKIFLKLKGFNKGLYPNEENEFLNRLRKKGFDAVYHPGVFVYRPRRDSLSQILYMFFRYGYGRMEHIRIRGVKDSGLFFIPVALLFYLFSLVFINSWLFILPLFIYFLLGLCSALGFSRRRKKTYLAILLPFLFLLVHLSYALGMISGLKTGLFKKQCIKSLVKIKVIRYKKFKDSWPVKAVV